MAKYTVKEFRENKDQIVKLANMLPPVFTVIVTKYAIPGFRLINEGMKYFKNEEVDPCRDYFLTHSDFEPLDLVEVLKNDFMDRGLEGLKQRVDHIRVMHNFQKMKYPHLFIQTKTA